MSDIAIELAKVKIPHRKTPKKVVAGRMIMIAIGAILMAVGLELFLVPNQILDGGVVGVSIIISHLTGVRLGVFIFILNIPFFFLGYKQIGKTFALSTLFGITILSLCTSYLHHIDAFTKDLLLSTVFGGIVLGVGVGLVIRHGGSLDGSEILAILFNKALPFSVGEIIMIINLVIFSVAGFVFTWEQAMYSFIQSMRSKVIGMKEFFRCLYVNKENTIRSKRLGVDVG